MKTALFLMFTFAGLATCRAQLGESEEKCRTLFGKPFRSANADASGVKTDYYRTPDFQVTAAFKDGNAVYFVYKKSDGSNMKDADVESVLKTHSTEQRRWFRKVITGERRPVVGASGRLRSPFHDPQHGPREWHVLGHEEFGAAYYFEKNVLVIWNSKSGFNGEEIVRRQRL